MVLNSQRTQRSVGCRKNKNASISILCGGSFQNVWITRRSTVNATPLFRCNISIPLFTEICFVQSTKKKKPKSVFVCLQKTKHQLYSANMSWPMTFLPPAWAIWTKLSIWTMKVYAFDFKRPQVSEKCIHNGWNWNSGALFYSWLHFSPSIHAPRFVRFCCPRMAHSHFLSIPFMSLSHSIVVVLHNASPLHPCVDPHLTPSPTPIYRHATPRHLTLAQQTLFGYVHFWII